MNIINEQIKYTDNFLPQDLIDSIYNKALSSQWGKGQSNDEENDSWFWHLNIDDSEEAKNLDKIIDNQVTRIYINGQTYSQHGDFHQDDEDETYLIGLNKNWTVKSGGATELLLENNTSLCIYPLYNRAIIFNAKIFHRALPNININDFRMTLAIKTRRK